MPYRISKTLMLGVALLLALDVAAAAQGNLDADRGDQSTTYVLSPASAAAFKASLIPDGQSVLVVPAADFADDGFEPDSAFFSFFTGEFSGSGTPAASYGCLMAPVYLRDGATVTALIASLHDGDVNFSATMLLWKVDNFSAAPTLMASVVSPAANPPQGDVIVGTGFITDPLVTYPDDSIYLTTCVWSPDIRIVSAQIFFTE